MAYGTNRVSPDENCGEYLMSRSKHSLKNPLIYFGIAVLAVFGIVACSGDPEVVVETVVVEKIVEVEKVVEKIVEVPKIEEKIVIATAAPTAAPTALPPKQRASLVKIATDGTLGEGGPESSIHPFHNTGAGALFYNRLINLTGSFDPIAHLAESWSANSDASEWTFNLRQGVKFHDGSDFTADDVVYSYAYMLDPDNGSPGVGQFTRFMDENSFTKIDDFTVKFTPLTPQAEVPLLLHSKEIAVVPDGSTFDSLKAATNGTGPYVFSDFDHTSQVWVLQKNANYWEPEKPRTDTLEYFGIADETARVAAISTGAVDLITATGGAVKVAQLAALDSQPEVNLLKATSPAISLILYMEIDTPPFDDLNVRKAMKLVADREFIADVILNGLAFPGSDNPIPPFWPVAFRDTATQQDIELAKELLAESGYNDDNPLKLQLYVADIHAGALEMVQAYQEMAFEAGVEIELITVPKARYWDTSWLKNPFGISAWGIRPPSQALSIAYSSDASWPETHWFRPDYDALLEEAAATVDGTARANLYKDAQRMLNDEGGLINLLFTRPVDAIRAECQGYAPPIPFYQRDFTTIECVR
jgi:peptide/nickel transport system substrate-binding protein